MGLNNKKVIYIPVSVEMPEEGCITKLNEIVVMAEELAQKAGEMIRTIKGREESQQETENTEGTE